MSEEDVAAAVMPTLNSIVDELLSFYNRAREVLRQERRSRKRVHPQDMIDSLQKLSAKLREVNECLREVEEVPSEEKKNQGKKNSKPSKRGYVEEEESANQVAQVEERGGRKRGVGSKQRVEEVEEVEERAGVVKKSRAKKLRDGGACLVEGSESVVFFVLASEGENRRFECPLLSQEDERVSVERKQLQPVDFRSLEEGMQARYLSLLAADIARRFHENAPVLFKDHGQDMLNVREAVLEDASKVGVFLASVSKHTLASKQLSAATNTVLMLAARLHAALAAEKQNGWYASFKRQLSEFCSKSCMMKVSTVERYLVAGSLMLRSKVLTCMLPSFLVLNAEAIGRLLEDEGVVESWEGLENGRAMEIEGGGEEGTGLGGEMEEGSGEERIGAVEEQEGTGSADEQDGSGEQNFSVSSGRLEGLHLGEEHLLNSLQSGVLDECLQNLFGEDDSTEKCDDCGLVGGVVFLSCDAGKQHFFCWRCNGYSSAPLDKVTYPGSEIRISTYVFCREHLDELESCQRPYKEYLKLAGENAQSIQDFVNAVQAEEARHMARIFSAEFALVPVKPNGWCMFSCVALAVRAELAEVVGRMKKFAPSYFRRKEAPCVVENRQTCLTLWKELDVNTQSTIDAFWSSEAGDLLIPMMAECLDVTICTWSIQDGKLVKSPLVYPEGNEKDQKIDLFKSNVLVEHYDLMIKK
jgi:hypothetical protein